VGDHDICHYNYGCHVNTALKRLRFYEWINQLVISNSRPYQSAGR